MTAESDRQKIAALERWVDRSSKEKDALRKALKIATDAIKNASVAVFPSRQGHYKRNAAERASTILLEVEAQLSQMELPMHQPTREYGMKTD